MGTSGYESTGILLPDGVHQVTGSKPFGIIVVGYDEWVGFLPMTPQGTYALRFDMPADVMLVHLRGLPDEPGLSVLKLLVTPRNEDEMRAGFSRLLEDSAVLQSTKGALVEAFM